MSDAHYHNLLQHQGFTRIGELNYRLQLSIWWNAQNSIQILLMKLGPSVLLKGERSYYLQSSADRETWARDIGPLHDYLETHFPEIRIAFAHFRDVPASLAQREAERELIAEAPTRPLPTLETIQHLQQQLNAAQRDADAMARLLSLSRRPGDLLSGYVQQQSRGTQPQIITREQDLQREKRRYELLKHLQREYQRKGSAAIFTFSISSNLQMVDRHERFGDALASVTKELKDYDRFQIKQKLQGARLKIQVTPARQPVITWIEQWLGGALSPEQLGRLRLPDGCPNDFISASGEHVILTPDEPIMVDGVTRQPPKHVAAHTLRSMLNRLDEAESGSQSDKPDQATPECMPLLIGKRVDRNGLVQGPAIFPLKSAGHTIVSGTTGSGKSFLARVLLEEASRHKSLKILIIDPRNQFSGLLVPEDRPAILARYEQFALRPQDARGFEFQYIAPASGITPGLPANLASLSRGRTIVSFKSVDEAQRCSLSADILTAAFDTFAVGESEHPRLLIAIDEAHLLTRRRVGKSAAGAAAQAEQAMDRIAREGRKYGIMLLLITQTFKSFSQELASLRQLTATKVFLRNSDLELEYAADIIPDSRELVHLPTATAIIHNAIWGTQRFCIRPPLSKVCELSDEQVRRILNADSHAASISPEARSLLVIIKHHAAQSASPLNITQLAEKANLTSRRKLQGLIAELEQAYEIRTHHLPDRGNPRVVELLG